ncbi:MAG: hypothetical protein M0Q12_09420 [Synergistaceae bacterium]|jgi:hypothetical protein|nr:hypothetical protein [Synergistaceae bacterium]
MEKWVVNPVDVTIKKHPVVISLKAGSKVLSYDLIDGQEGVWEEDFVPAERCFDTFIEAKECLVQELKEEIQKLKVRLKLKKYQLFRIKYGNT